ncbi:MAG: response regulator, partial [Actinomycetota bacterium]
PALVVGSAERRAAFLVDAVVDAREVVVKSLPPPLPRVHKAAGATVLSNGEVVVVLNVADLLSSVERLPPTAAALREPGTPSEPEQPLVLVADDSITTRTLEKNILESAGYRVRVAADGVDAWRMLEEEGADLLLTDVVMPRLDGFALTEKVRADDRFRHLPVVLVTSLDSPGNRERGIRTGADAYIAKGAFEQEKLLDTIRRLI